MNITIEAEEIATIATRTQVAQAIGNDAVAWVAPLAVALTTATFIPFVADSLALTIIVWALAAAVGILSFVRDSKSLGDYGYTEGFRKLGLRVIDPEADNLEYKARLFHKNIFKLFFGRYEVINIGIAK